MLYVALSRPRETFALVKVVDGSTTVAVDSATNRGRTSGPGTPNSRPISRSALPTSIHILSSRKRPRVRFRIGFGRSERPQSSELL